MTGDNHPISVWFLCKSCGFTFHFQHVDKFLEHKKEMHFSEFEKIRCIVFEEKLDNNQEHNNPDKASEVLESNLLHVDKVDLSEGEVQCFWEPEALPSASISTNGIISQVSPAGNELDLQDPKLFSSYVLARRLTSLELQLTQGNEIGEPSATDYLNSTFLQSMPTILPLQKDKDKLHGVSGTCSSQELNDVYSDPAEISSSRSGNSPNHSSFQLQLSSASGSGIHPSLIYNNDVIDEFENPAAVDVNEEIDLDFETAVNSNEINVEPEVDLSGLTTRSNKNRVNQKRWSDASITSKYNPFVLVKRLKLTDCAIGPEEDAPSDHSDYDNDNDYQPVSPQDSTYSDSDFNDDESRTRNQRHQGNSSSPIRARQGRGAFIFPSPESDNEDVNDPLTLKDWLLHHKETTDSNGTKNIILLNPDPTESSIGLVTLEDPITCRLCSKKLTSVPEVKIHVKYCWLLNKNRHRFCVVCAKSYNRPDGLKRHNKINHGTEERQIFKCQYCPEQFKTETSWNRHKSTHPEMHETLKSFSCKLCNKSFCNKTRLRQHLLVHSNDRPFKCDQPNCSFASKTARQQKSHIMCHDNPRFRPQKVTFKFPYWQIPEADCESDDMPLADWIAKQTEEVEGTPPNVILLEPDPTKENVIPITQENYISCKLCCEKLTSDARVKIHVTHCWLRNKARHRYCIPCNKKLKSVNSLMSHCIRTHGTEEEKEKLRRFKCQQCAKTYTDSRALRIHVETHKSKEEQDSEDRPFVCETCGSRFIQKDILQLHLRTHSSERPFRCPHSNCAQAFKTRAGRHKHMESHSDSRPHECQFPGCSKSFKRSEGLKLHSQRHEGKLHGCAHENCNKKFATSQQLKRHIKVRHTEGGIEKKFECDVCHKKFAQTSQLTRHAPIHLNLKEKPFKCSHEGCKEAFNSKLILEEHERKHTGELPFVCDSCGKAYAKVWSFKKHMRVHENAHNKHSCPICPRKFPGTWELKQHLLIHEKGKQFICSHCGQKCMTKANLNLHEKTHSKGNVRIGKRKNAKKVQTSSESECQNDSASESEAISTEESTQSDEES